MSTGHFICIKFAPPDGCLLQGIHRHLQISEGGEMRETYFVQECLRKVATTAGWDSGVSGHGQQTCHLPTGGTSVSDKMQRSQRITWMLLLSRRCQVDYRYLWLHHCMRILKLIVFWAGREDLVSWSARLNFPRQTVDMWVMSTGWTSQWEPEKKPWWEPEAQIHFTWL